MGCTLPIHPVKFQRQVYTFALIFFAPKLPFDALNTSRQALVVENYRMNNLCHSHHRQCLQSCVALFCRIGHRQGLPHYTTTTTAAEAAAVTEAQKNADQEVLVKIFFSQINCNNVLYAETQLTQPTL